MIGKSQILYRKGFYGDQVLQNENPDNFFVHSRGKPKN